MEFDIGASLAGARLVGWLFLTVMGFLLLEFAFEERKQSPSAFWFFLIGIGIVLLSIGTQQYFWWRNEQLIATGNCLSHGIDYNVQVCNDQREWYALARYVTPPQFFGIVVGCVLAAPQILTMRFRLPVLASSVSVLAIAIAIYCAGYILASG